MIRFKLNDTRFYETQRFGFDASRYILWKNEWYVVHDDFLRSLKTLGDDDFLYEPYAVRKWNTDMAGEVDSFLLMCWGGLGDLVSLSPVFRTLKTVYGVKRLWLSSPGITKHWFGEWVDHTLGYPVMQKRLEGADAVFVLENIFEDTMRKNLTDVFAEKLGIVIPDELRHPFLHVDPCTVEYVRTLLPPKRGKYVAIHFSGSVPERSIPIEKAMALAFRIADEGHTAILYGKWTDLSTFKRDESGGKTSVRELRPGVYNLCGLLENQDEMVAAMSLMDFFIGPDSGLLHLAGALGVPGLGIFIPYHSSIRIGYYPSLSGVDVDPKYYTCNRETFFPEEEQRALYNEAIESIDWEAIAREAVS